MWLFFVRKKQQQPKIQRTKNARKSKLHPLQFAFKIQCEIAWEIEQKIVATTVATAEVVIVGAVTAAEEQKRSNNWWNTVVCGYYLFLHWLCQVHLITSNRIWWCGGGAHGWCNQNRINHIATAKRTKLSASFIDWVRYYLSM